MGKQNFKRNNFHRPAVQKFRPDHIDGANHHVAAAVPAPPPTQFCKDIDPLDTLDAIVEPLKLAEGDQAKWITYYYNSIIAGDKNGERVFSAAPEPKVPKEPKDDALSAFIYERECAKFDARQYAAWKLVDSMVDATSSEIINVLNCKSAGELGLPNGYCNFDAYVRTMNEVDLDPVLVFRMICRVIIRERAGYQTSLSYAVGYFGSIAMDHDESIYDFKKRFMCAQFYIKTLWHDGIDIQYPWVEEVDDQLIDFTIPCFLSKLRRKDYRDEVEEGNAAIMRTSLDDMPESIHEAVRKAEIHREVLDHIKKRSREA